MELDEKIVVITGATSGIGLVTATEIAKLNAFLVLPVRDIEKGEQAKKQIIGGSGNPEVYLMECDLGSFDSIRSFAKAFTKRFDRVHMLINNAGIWETERKETKDGIEMNFAVNHLAPFLLTNLLLDHIRSGSPSGVINVSSEAHRYAKINFDDLEGRNRYSWIRAYSQSKLCNILFTRHLAGMLVNDGVEVNCLHPGFVDTNLFQNMHPFFRLFFPPFMISTQKGAETTIHLATLPDTNEHTGQYFVKKRPKTASIAALDEEAAKRLWEVSRQYTGI